MLRRLPIPKPATYVKKSSISLFVRFSLVRKKFVCSVVESVFLCHVEFGALVVPKMNPFYLCQQRMTQPCCRCQFPTIDNSWKLIAFYLYCEIWIMKMSLKFHLTFASVFVRLFVRYPKDSIRGFTFKLFVSTCIGSPQWVKLTVEHIIISLSKLQQQFLQFKISLT